MRTTIVIPTGADTASLGGLLDSLEGQLTGEDELLLVDTSGGGAIAAWAEDSAPAVARLVDAGDADFASAIQVGAREASGETLVVLAPQMRPEPGYIEALLEALADEDVAIAAPRVEDGESSVALSLDDGRLHRLPRDHGSDPNLVRPVPFAPLGAFAMAREAFQGFDPMLVPNFGPRPGWCEVDLGLSVWRGGMQVVEVPAARAGRTTGVEEDLPDELVRAAQEKNRLLTLWKFLDTKADAHDHVASLWRDALDASIAGRRNELIWMGLALQELPRVGKARGNLGVPARALEQVLRVSDPVG